MNFNKIETVYKINIPFKEFDTILSIDYNIRQSENLYEILNKIPGVSNTDYDAGKGAYIFVTIEAKFDTAETRKLIQDTINNFIINNFKYK